MNAAGGSANLSALLVFLILIVEGVGDLGHAASRAVGESLASVCVLVIQ